MSPEPERTGVIYNVRQVNRLPGGHRPFNTSTIMAQLMLRKQVRVCHVMIATGVHQRMMTEYLARRRKPSPKTLNILARYFRVEPRQLIDPDGFLTLAPGYDNAMQGRGQSGSSSNGRVRGHGL